MNLNLNKYLKEFLLTLHFDQWIWDNAEIDEHDDQD